MLENEQLSATRFENSPRRPIRVWLTAAVVAATIHSAAALAASGSGQTSLIDPTQVLFGATTTDVHAYSRAPSGDVNQVRQNPTGLPGSLFEEGPQNFGSLLGVQPAVGYVGVSSKDIEAAIVSQSTGAQATANFDPVSFTCAASGVATSAGSQAAAACIDPRTVLTFTAFTYQPVLEFMELEVNGTGESAFARFFAEIDGQELFSVEIAAVDQLLTNADLLISLSVDLSRLSVIPAIVETDLRNAISVAAGTATLNSYTLFDSSLTLLTGESVAEGASAGALVAGQNVVVPEPPILLLALIGLLGAGFAARKRRVH